MKNIKIYVTTLVIVAVSAFALAGTSLFEAAISENATIEKGVYIGGIDVSGMTAAEATGKVNEYVNSIKDEKIVLIGPDANITVKLSDMGIYADTEEAVKEAVSIGRAGGLLQRYKDLQDLKTKNIVVDMRLGVDKQVTGNLLYENREKLNVEPSDNRVKLENGTFVYVEGQQGNEVDIVNAVNELNEYIGSNWEVAPEENVQFTLKNIITNPRGTKEQLAVIKDVLGTFSTDFAQAADGKKTNIQTGAGKINGQVLYPGDQLSVYELVTPFTEENGYDYAGTYSNGDVFESLGGGICQVSTTLYNAAIRAELEIVERFSHSMIVTYVDPSADAAIAGTYKDLKLKNNYNFPIYVEGVCKNGILTFNIYGKETRPANREVIFEAEILKETVPNNEYEFSEKFPIGYQEEARAIHIGYSARLWKIIKVDGKETEKIQFNKSWYQPSGAKILVGTVGATEAQLETIKKAIETKNDEYILKVIAEINKKPESSEGGTSTEGGETTEGGTTSTETTNPTIEGNN